MLLPESLNQPELIAAVTLIVAAIVHYQRGLTFREYRELMRFKRRVFPILDRMQPFNFRSFVHPKGAPEADPEHYATTDADARTVWRRLTDAGGSPHLVSSLKRRPNGMLSKWHFVWTHEDGTQTEVYVFSDGALYCHHETAVSDVDGHLSDGIEPGDPRGVLAGVAL